MPRECAICKKKVQFGHKYAYRGLAKHRGGVGIKVTGKTKRKFRPNLQRVRAWINGGVQRIRVCTRCIKSGKIKKPPQRRYVESASKATG